MNYFFGDDMMAEKTLYFGYGSNLDNDDWADWCKDRGYDPDGMTEIGAAWLPEYSMKFHYHSTGRSGGAADVVRIGPGAAVPGVLFHLDAQSLAAMDIKEGVSANCYEQRIVNVCTPDGNVHEALTYTVVKGKRENRHIAPTEQYQRLVRAGLELRGLPTDDLENAIQDGGPHFPIPHVFIYGTLLQGESRHVIIQDLSPISSGPATTAKVVLLDLGQFPGMILAGTGAGAVGGVDAGVVAESVVKGELYTFSDMFTVLQYLDEIEGYYGAGDDGSLFRRVLIEVDVEGEKMWAWAYFYNGTQGKNSAWPVIESGDWRHHRSGD